MLWCILIQNHFWRAPDHTRERWKQSSKNLKMDTDDLSKEAYKAIMIESERFNHDLTLQFGLLAEECKDETEYLKSSLKLIQELQKMDEDDLTDIFFDDIPDIKIFKKALEKIRRNIMSVKDIPIKDRHYDF